MGTMNLECTVAFLFALWAFSEGHWLVGVVALVFISWRVNF